MQLVGELLWAARCRARFAPTEAGAVVGADARRRRDLGLDRTPVEGERAQARIEYHSWAAVPNAVQMQAIATDIHELPRRWVALAVPRCHDRFVAGAAHCKQQEQRQQSDQDAYGPKDKAIRAAPELR